MLHVRRWLSPLPAAAALLAVSLLGGPAAHAQDGEPSPEQLWDDFNHYVLIARHDLAASSGQALLQRTDPSALLDVVEAGDYDDYEQTLDRAASIPELAAVSVRLEEALTAAAIERARDPERVAADIARLNEGQLAFTNAVVRLRAAGQLAVPPMLAVLADEDQDELRPFVTSAMVSLGRRAVYPLAIALPHLDAPTQRRVARILTEIGYPLALPFIQRVLDDPSITPEVRDTMRQAFAELSREVAIPRRSRAVGLFLKLGNDQYAAATRGVTPAGFEVVSGEGLVWRHNELAGLVSIPVPDAIFADVLAMQSARFALELDPSNDDALQLWLMANLRRGLTLPEGEVDPTYGPDRRPPSFYALLAGPRQLLAILDRALADNDGELALAALEGLDATAATEALIRGGVAASPMLRAMNYPAGVVRFEAAAAMADARPESPYEGSDLVVPALAEALRGGGARVAVAIAETAGRATTLGATLRELGFDTIAGTPGELEDIGGQVALRPAVDVVIGELTIAGANEVMDALGSAPRLRNTPVVLAAAAGDRVRLEALADDRPLLTVIGDRPDADTLRDALETAIAAATDPDLDAAAAEARALRSLALMRDIGLGASVYDLGVARPALMQALSDDRASVAVAAAGVVAALPAPDAQRAIATRAFEADGPLRLAMLAALADSATRYGNLLSDDHADTLGKLITEGDDETAVAAARAYGALSLPTQRSVDQVFAE